VAWVIEPVRGAEAAAACRALFLEYQEALGVDLDFAAELAGLPGQYAPPCGELLLASVDGQPAACVALRQLTPREAEMKRMYVRAAHRGTGLGRALAERVVAEARLKGYEALRLDTLPALLTAQALYAKMGFREIARYNDNPLPGVRYFELDLRS
jgi:GNAT superfamily N-acetyltransferase